MKKGASILFVLIIILSGARFYIAKHYCSDQIASEVVSLSGKLASCGMECTEEPIPLPGNYLTSHCCFDKRIIVEIIDNFTDPASLINQKFQNLHQNFYLSYYQIFTLTSPNNNLNADNIPPGFFPRAVDLADICVFRI
jgi:hypothetical protein